jgi:hypothetical protein
MSVVDACNKLHELLQPETSLPSWFRNLDEKARARELASQLCQLFETNGKIKDEQAIKRSQLTEIDFQNLFSMLDRNQIKSLDLYHFGVSIPSNAELRKKLESTLAKPLAENEKEQFKKAETGLMEMRVCLFEFNELYRAFKPDHVDNPEKVRNLVEKRKQAEMLVSKYRGTEFPAERAQEGKKMMDELKKIASHPKMLNLEAQSLINKLKVFPELKKLKSDPEKVRALFKEAKECVDKCREMKIDKGNQLAAELVKARDHYFNVTKGVDRKLQKRSAAQSGLFRKTSRVEKEEREIKESRGPTIPTLTPSSRKG